MHVQLTDFGSGLIVDPEEGRYNDIDECSLDWIVHSSSLDER